MLDKSTPLLYDKAMKKLIIFRGPSGSGKSTAAKALGGLHFEADEFFMRSGTYVFEANKLSQAHADCQRRVREAVSSEKELVVVSNTSMTRWELTPYLQMAKEFDYEVTIYRIKGPWDAKLFASRNTHGVTKEIVQRQINKYQPLESEQEYA